MHKIVWYIDVTMTQCAACLNSVERDAIIKCKKCSLAYHHFCQRIEYNVFLNLSENRKLNFVCTKCQKQKNNNTGQNISVTPELNVEVSQEDNIAVEDTPSLVSRKLRSKQPYDSSITRHTEQEKQIIFTKEDIREIIQSELKHILATEIRNLMQECLKVDISPLKAELSATRKEINHLKSSLEELKGQYNTYKKEIAQKIQSVEDRQNKEILELAANNRDIISRIEIIEQNSRAANLEIQCLPEHRIENLIATTKQLARVVSFDLKEEDLLMCTRVAKANTKSERPRSIVVKLRSPLVRDSFLASVLKFNKSHSSDKLNSGHLGIGGNKCPVFVTEHLSPHYKSLHRATRIKAKENSYKFVWVRAGRIFIRKSETSPAILIKNFESLSKL